jgi:hypothetical protein
VHRSLDVRLRFLVVVLLQVRPGAVVVRNGAAAATKGHFVFLLPFLHRKKKHTQAYLLRWL